MVAAPISQTLPARCISHDQGVTAGLAANHSGGWLSNVRIFPQMIASHYKVERIPIFAIGVYCDGNIPLARFGRPERMVNDTFAHVFL